MSNTANIVKMTEITDTTKMIDLGVEIVTTETEMIVATEMTNVTYLTIEIEMIDLVVVTDKIKTKITELRVETKAKIDLIINLRINHNKKREITSMKNSIYAA